ncbi:A. THALIANA ABC2 HOMOLOG 1, ABC2 homolog 1, ATP-binding cassette A2 [Hibiscus trionum]|uniref:A. THALIANA ABC2 HOMOLOG 1, ABC2 homolog 1, ATP-binding cassette A2 n=1 Tax=Hibiscus trionum TaxID=183268 RepID=A0A9W7JGY5_HIBTR|nr:A. THALIANA ABC2 HOMOLOG 1, ABC2 homolog 1, ATP-binding cassette A2 [Hibiscus trionum]
MAMGVIELLCLQFKALLKKNLILSWRNKRSTFIQLFSSLFFIFLIFGIDKATNAQRGNSTAYETVRDPKPWVAPAIPSCEDRYFMKLPCYDFVWSGNESRTVGRIVRAIRENNPGRPIPETKVKSFRTTVDVDEWLYNNPMLVRGAFHFRELNGSVISYGLQTNSTVMGSGGQDVDPTFTFQIPLQVAAEREIARLLIGDPNLGWTVELKEFPHPAKGSSSSIASIGPTFFLAIAMFTFVFEIGSLVSEKELKLRQAMTMMGLLDSAYWLSWLTWEGFMTLISSLFIVLFGMMFQFDFFLKNSFAVLFFVFFLFQLNMVGFAFMLSSFISKSSSATTIGFFIFIIGFFTQIVTSAGFPYSAIFSRTHRIIWSLFPPNLLAQALKILSKATNNPQDKGVSWSRRIECAPNDAVCVMTINDIYIWLVATFFVWFVLAIYFDNIIPNASGVRRPIFYFLRPGYWTGKGGNEEEGGVCSCIGSAPPVDHNTPDDEDVREEENLVQVQAREGIVDPNVAVQIRGLAKTYPGTISFSCSCKYKKTAPYHAVKGLWVNLAKDQLFCLLGPNGAGKTTAINCLTGITPVTSGDALIYGNSVRSSVSMSNIRKIIGVCPQFDILWNALSGQEHLELFANVKGLPPATIESVVKKSLAEVRLTEAAKVRAGSYSGGMRRRLSVAVSLLGDPKLVILDEPTTGMDPISRRHVWDIIERAKRGRVIVLTTHSMEEADVLSDRIGIMVKGRLSCLGTSIRLKSRFGTGFIANVSFTGSNNEHSPSDGDAVGTTYCQKSVKQFFKNHLDVEPKEENRNYLTFVIPHDREKLLAKFFKELEERGDEFGIADIQLSLATMEEVFLNIARQAELESAAAEGRLVTLTLTSGASVEIPVGARFVGIPGTESAENPRGIMVEVYWEQDDSGTLCISGHSAEIPLPRNVQPMVSPPNNRNRFGQRVPIRGVVIEPNESFTPTS